MKKYSIISFIFLLLVITAFTSYQAQRYTTHPLQLPVPKGWPPPLYDFSKNPLTEEGFQLGRKLFYDGRLSKDGNFPCASCHQQFAAFATYDHNLSHGFNNSFTQRNAPALFNLAWQKEFMWDGGINHLDLVPLAPLTDSNEMAEDLQHVLNKLRSDAVYRKMFKAAFGDETINTQRLAQALSQFELMLVSNNSKYDRVMRNEDSFNLPQRIGYAIFKNKCANCHAEPLFTDFSFRNIGLPADSFLKDAGRMRITRNSKDSLLFKVPSLRNVQLTFPYMHDGSIVTLKEALIHYRSGIVHSSTIDSSLQNGIALSNFEIGQLTAFLYTLTDSVLLRNTRFAPPGYENRIQQKPAFDSHIYKE